MANTTKYFVQNGAKIEGPYILHDVLNLPLTQETLVWKEGMQSWSKLTELEEFSAVFAKTPPPLVIDFGDKKIIEESAHLEKREAVHHNRANRYFIYADNKTTGPFSSEQIREMNLNSDVLLWKDGMKAWEKRSEFKEFESVGHVPPPIPADSTYKQTVKEPVTRKRSNSSLFYIILLLCILFLFLFFFCRLNSCCSHWRNCPADTAVNQKSIMVIPDTTQPKDKNISTADSVADAAAKVHQKYLNEIAEQVYNCYMINGSYYKSFNADNNDTNDNSMYAAYLNNISQQLRALYIKVNNQDSIGDAVNTDSTAYSKYITYIQHKTAHSFYAHINAANDSDNLYDKTYLLCVEQLLQELNRDKKHPHHEHSHDNYHHHHHDDNGYKPKNNDGGNTSFYKLPDIFLGHSAQEIYDKYGDDYTNDDDFQNNSYTITYISPSFYEENYIINKESDKCTKFTIKFFSGSYYNWYLQQLFPGSFAINSTNRHWRLTYENQPVEVDLKTIGIRCTPMLVYYFTDNKAN